MEKNNIYLLTTVMEKNNKKSKGAKDRERKNEYIINRAPHKGNHTIITNLLIRDPRLNVIDIGIMTKLLSDNDKIWIFNKEYFRETISGIGKKKYDSSWKKLQQLGYVSKKRIQSGVRWTINEIPTHSTSNDDFITSKNERNENNSITSHFNPTEINPTEINPIENRLLYNTIPSFESADALPKEEERKKEKNNNARANLETSSSLSSDLSSEQGDKVKDDNLNNHTPIKNEVNNNTPNENDLKFLLNNSPTFKAIYNMNTEYNTSYWYYVDISSYSNTYIAYALTEKAKGNPIKDIPNNTYNMLWYMGKYSKNIPNSKLWQAIQFEAQNDQTLINKIFMDTN